MNLGVNFVINGRMKVMIFLEGVANIKDTYNNMIKHYNNPDFYVTYKICK